MDHTIDQQERFSTVGLVVGDFAAVGVVADRHGGRVGGPAPGLGQQPHSPVLVADRGLGRDRIGIEIELGTSLLEGGRPELGLFAQDQDFGAGEGGESAVDPSLFDRVMASVVDDDQRFG